MTHPHDYTVVGAGAIGGTLAHHLARSGHSVAVVDADVAHIDAIRADGLVVVRDGVRTATPVDLAVTPDDPAGPESVGRVILAVKAQATDAALDWVAPRLADDGFVVSLQNGLNEQRIADRVGSDRTVGAFVNLFADVVGPGEVRDGGRAPSSSARWTAATRNGSRPSLPTSRPGDRRRRRRTFPASSGPSSASARCSPPLRRRMPRWPT